MTSHTVVVLEPGYAAYDTEAAVMAEFDVRIASVAPDIEAVGALRALDPVAILVRERTVDAAVIDACPNLKVVVRYGVGVDNVDLDHAKSLGIYVANVPNYGAEIEVSEHALALYLAVQRRILMRDHEVRNGKWGVGQSAVIPSRKDAVLGLIGCGKIGLETAKKFAAFGFRTVLVFDPYLSDKAAKDAGVQKVDLSNLCKCADVVSVHAPLTSETRHILDADHIALMKPTSIVINVSRGGLLDENALAKALVEGRLFGAGIDVFEQEPVTPENPLLKCPNTVVSDHAAWYSERSVTVLQHLAAEEITRVLSGDQPKSWKNPW